MLGAIKLLNQLARRLSRLERDIFLLGFAIFFSLLVL